ARALQGAEGVQGRRRASPQLAGKGRQVRARGHGMTDGVVVTNVDGRPLSRRGLDTRRRLLDAAEVVFGRVGYHDASVVKLAEHAGVAAGTFYLYFDSKK